MSTNHILTNVPFPTTGRRSAADLSSYDASAGALNLGQAPAVAASAEDLEKDKLGYTNMNLHRRIDPRTPSKSSPEVAPRDYVLNIHGVHSYRTTTVNSQDDSATEDLVP